MAPPTYDKIKSPRDDQSKKDWRKLPQNSFRDQKTGRPTWKGNDCDYRGKVRPTHKKKGKGKTQNKVDVLKKKEEYSHLVNSTKLTVFDWDSTIVLRNLPAQVDVVRKLVQRDLKDIGIKKFCPIKKTFKSNALVTLACVLNDKADVNKAIVKLTNLKVGDYNIIVSRFVKPHSFISNAFSACIINIPNDASEKHLSEILKDCGVISCLDVEYSESGTVKKVLVNLSNASDLALLLHKDGTPIESTSIQVVPIKPTTSIIVGNVHAKISKDKLAKIFGDDVLLVQKMSNMVFQIFLKDEESAEKALIKDGESVKDLIISVRPWSKKNSKQHKVFVHLFGDQNKGKTSFNINEFLQDCGKLCSITPIKKDATFIVTFESKEGQKAALQLNGTVVNGITVELTKKPPGTKKSKEEVTDRNTARSATSSSSKKTYFE